MNKYFLIIICYCGLLANNFQAAQDNSRWPLIKNFVSSANTIWYQITQWVSSIKKPLIINKQMVVIGGVGVLAIAGGMWWYKRPPKFPPFDSVAQLRKAAADRAIAESKARKKEFLRKSQDIDALLNQIEQKAQELMPNNEDIVY